MLKLFMSGPIALHASKGGFHGTLLSLPGFTTATVATSQLQYELQEKPSSYL